MLVPMVAVGCDGGTNASGNVIPEVILQMFELARKGVPGEAMALQYRVMELFDAMLNPFEFPDGFRAAAEMRGFKMGRGRQPLTPSQEVDRSALQSVLQCILSDFKFVEPPAAGCAPRTGNVSGDRVGQIVYEVLHELEQRGLI